MTQTVNKGTTEAAIKVKPKKPKEGGSARIKVKMKAVAPASGKPDGKVVVKDGRKKLGKFKVKKGKAKLRLTDLEAGTHKIKAIYKGSGNWNRDKAKKKIKVQAIRH